MYASARCGHSATSLVHPSLLSKSLLRVPKVLHYRGMSRMWSFARKLRCAPTRAVAFDVRVFQSSDYGLDQDVFGLVCPT